MFRYFIYKLLTCDLQKINETKLMNSQNIYTITTNTRWPEVVSRTFRTVALGARARPSRVSSLTPHDCLTRHRATNGYLTVKKHHDKVVESVTYI